MLDGSTETSEIGLAVNCIEGCTIAGFLAATPAVASLPGEFANHQHLNVFLNRIVNALGQRLAKLQIHFNEEVV